MCAYGTTVTLTPPSRCLTPNRVRNASVVVDACLATAVTALWAHGYATVHACCGHGQGHGDIMVVGQVAQA